MTQISEVVKFGIGFLFTGILVVFCIWGIFVSAIDLINGTSISDEALDDICKELTDRESRFDGVKGEFSKINEVEDIQCVIVVDKQGGLNDG